MRELKFRAWHPNLRRMFYTCRVGPHDWANDSGHYGGEHDTLMQFTGLLDKHGKEIYESDIIRLGGI